MAFPGGKPHGGERPPDRTTRALLSGLDRLPLWTIRAIRFLRGRSPLLTRAAERLTARAAGSVGVIARGPGAGLKFNPAGTMLECILGTWEGEVQDVLAERCEDGDVVYDVGANVGFHALIAARLVGPTGRVYAFEPLPGSVLAIQENAARNDLDHIEILETALGARSGTAIMQLGDNLAHARLLATADQVRSREAVAVGMQTHTVEVALETVDRLIAHGLRPPTLVKIDVEGAELDVIAGMAETLRTIRPAVLCELHGTNQGYVDLMSSIGYETVALDDRRPVERAHWNVHTLALPV